MENEIELSVHGLELNYARNETVKKIKYAKTSGALFFILMLILSAVFFFIQISDNSIFRNLLKYSRIKNALSSWKPLVLQKSKVNSSLGKRAALNRSDLFRFRCVDFGDFILPVRLNKYNYLPEAIRRGEGDGWMIKKADKYDPGASQFCEFVLARYSDTITCGTEMFNLLGYSGYFETGHWCKSFLNIV